MGRLHNNNNINEMEWRLQLLEEEGSVFTLIVIGDDGADKGAAALIAEARFSKMSRKIISNA